MADLLEQLPDKTVPVVDIKDESEIARVKTMPKSLHELKISVNRRPL